MYAERLARTRAAMADAGVDVLLASVGPDLPYLIGYEAMPLPRLTMLVLHRDGPATLVIPRLEVARVVERDDLFAIHGWDETDDPIGLVADLCGRPGTVAVGDQTWARHVVDLLDRMPATRWRRADGITGPLRARKDAFEIDQLRAAGAAADRVAAQLQAGEVRFVGRTEAEVSEEIARRLLAEGHAHVNFSIVAAGANAASPHHHASDRVIAAGEVVLCDFGGVFATPDGTPGYCSGVTRMFWVGGEPPTEFVELYDVLHRAQSAAVAAAVVGTPCQDVDRAARSIIDAAGFGAAFIHRTGHGIGLFEHEDPYIVAGNDAPLVAGNAFSIEPGIYLEGRWGARLEDIVVATPQGPEPMNRADHRLTVLDA